ncbi:MAG: hypothetical protein RR585_10265 [Coprobacillus sp.]
MAIEKMVLLNMTFDRHDLDEVLFQLKGSQYYYPQSSSKIINNVKGVHSFEKDEVYTKLTDRIIEIASALKLELHKDLSADRSIDNQKADQYLKGLEEEIKKIKDVQDQLILERDENKTTLEMVNKLSLTDVDLDQMHACQYITARFGRFKRANLDKIKYYDGRPFIFNKLGEDHHYVWCCYIVSNNLLLEVDNIFQALGFEEIKIPSFVHGTIDGAKKELEDEVHAMEEYILRMDQKITILRETQKVDLLKLYATSCFLKRIEEYKVFIVDYQSKCAIYGFIPVSRIDEFKKHFESIHSIEYQELPSDILDHKEVEAPTVVHNIKIVKPFEMISKVKQSDKIDATLAFALLYYAVFIIFLGDLGIGAILTLLGVLMRKKKMGALFLSLGIATFIGGFIYGDVFYTMSLYPALALPLSTVYKIVDGFVLLIAGTYTINAFKKMYLQRSAIDKVLSMKGICGLVCLYALLVYLGCAYEAHINLPIMPFAIVIVACLVLVMSKSFIKKKTS